MSEVEKSRVGTMDFCDWCKKEVLWEKCFWSVACKRVCSMECDDALREDFDESCAKEKEEGDIW